jgi:hypothetical protein
MRPNSTELLAGPGSYASHSTGDGLQRVVESDIGFVPFAISLGGLRVGIDSFAKLYPIVHQLPDRQRAIERGPCNMAAPFTPTSSFLSLVTGTP